MRTISDLILSDAVTDGDEASEVVDLRQSCIWSVQYNFVGGTPSSALIVHGSNNYNPNNPSAAVWSNIESVTISDAGSGIKNYENVGYAYGRVFNDYTSGTSALTVWSSKKGA